MKARGTALITAFLSQLSEAEAELGPPKQRISVFEAEFREDAKDVASFHDHDARVALWFGRDLPDNLQFSARSWSSLRIIVVVNRGPDSPVSVFVMEGPLFGTSDSSWAAWQLVTQNHSMPMHPADGSTFHGEHGADAFLRALPSFGIVPVVEKMRQWRAFLNRCGRREEPLVDSRFFDDGEGGISVSRQFASSMRAGRLAAGDVASYVPYNAKSQSAKAVPALVRRVPVALARWMGRYGLDVDAPSDAVVELGDRTFRTMPPTRPLRQLSEGLCTTPTTSFLLRQLSVRSSGGVCRPWRRRV